MQASQILNENIKRKWTDADFELNMNNTNFHK